nr:MAG TPA: hypothetical protein [Caudoviricetes sp.]
MLFGSFLFGKSRNCGFYTNLAICKPKSAGGTVTATT